jgi:enamine deaminase RidA (YjgF/YER057c/UK114 family)
MVPGGATEQATQLFKNMISLVEAAGGTKDKIVQVNTFGNDEAYMEPSHKAFEAAFPDAATRPAWNPLVSFVRSSNALMAEFVAVL